MKEVTEEVVVAEADVTVPSATASAKKGFREGEGQSLCQRLQDLQGCKAVESCAWTKWTNEIFVCWSRLGGGNSNMFFNFHP